MKMERGYPTYTVTPKAENAIVKGHPWVYDAEILNMEGETEFFRICIRPQNSLLRTS